jgi:hypothetical protein
MKKQSVAWGVVAGVLVSSTAWGQELSATAKADTDEGATAAADGEAEAPPAEPAAQEEEADDDVKPTVEPVKPASDIGASEGETDHSKVIGHFGVGYLGRQTMTIGAARTPIAAPVIGVRYWLSDFLGIDAGLGLNYSGGAQTTNADGADNVRKPGLFMHMIHVGVPLNFFSRGSFSFQLVPEMNFGWAFTGNQTDVDDNVIRDTGLHFSAGAHAGAELQFGFIGIPELSLQGNVGLYVQHEGGATRVDDGTTNVRTGDRTTTFGTTLGPDPWDVFTGSIAAMYYF